MMVLVWIWSCIPICCNGPFCERMSSASQTARIQELLIKCFDSLILTYKSEKCLHGLNVMRVPYNVDRWYWFVLHEWLHTIQIIHPSWIRFPGTESWQKFHFLNMMYIVPQKFLAVRSVYWKDTSYVKMNSWGKVYITTKQSPDIYNVTTTCLQLQVPCRSSHLVLCILTFT